MMLRTLEDAGRITTTSWPWAGTSLSSEARLHSVSAAASVRKLGSEVTVIEALPRLTRGVPVEIAEAIESRHIAEGVDLPFRRTDRPHHRNRRRGPPTAPASPRTSSSSELASCQTPTRGEAGLALDNGIAVDAELAILTPPSSPPATAAPSRAESTTTGACVWSSWRSAQELGALAARNMLGAAEPISAVPWFWSDQYDLSMQIAGIAAGASTYVRRDLSDGAFVLFQLPQMAGCWLQAASAPVTPSPRASASPK